MTDWTPGVKADATKVCDLLTDRYTNPTKNAIRRWVIAELKAAEPALVLDLWGGGLSAAEMAAAGLPVLSVDDGRSFAEFGITKPRGKRALTVKGDLDGYRTGWGSVVKYLPECDAAWLDFMGHPCHETERALAACKGKKIVVLTLMASRLAGHEGLSVESYIAMYRGLVEGLSGCVVRRVRKYRRRDGQWVLVLSAWQSQAHGWDRIKRADPEYRARCNARRRELSADPEYRARCSAQDAASRAAHRVARADPVFRAEENERHRVQQQAKRADPEYRARYTSALRRARDTYRAAHPGRATARQAAYRARKKAEQLNTGGEA